MLDEDLYEEASKGSALPLQYWYFYFQVSIWLWVELNGGAESAPMIDPVPAKGLT